ncbi:DNA ligase D [Aquibacillus koreensis]|uniref:DNA ligase (ATP) n=1 Tax=Aquibacillus koreensis TaxID=279446 RepID=A0A9X4AJV1_9BACI|nr:DNA ligase D [Aquibacillus koreensis]MCT2538251.1 DNA ligase D [Aquibacillus koreensis]MDC3420805.1 DNA ligase D [Aquibacillus koreensis]
MRLMQPKPTEDIPVGEKWIYEIKYDGFRAVLHWKKGKATLTSRNGVDLSANFPEIIAFCLDFEEEVEQLLPVQLDGEIVILNTKIQSNFPLLQKRGRLKAMDKINQAAMARPAHFLCFDMLEAKGKSLKNDILQKRKESLYHFFKKITPFQPVDWHKPLGIVEPFSEPKAVLNPLQAHLGEGLIAKRTDSRYIEGKSHGDWFKIKNWRTVTGIITSYNIDNGYFELSIYRDQSLQALGKFKHGLDGEALDTIKTLIRTKGEKHGNTYTLPPAICADVHCLEISEGDLREPQFKQFRFDRTPDDCTFSKVKEALCMFPASIELTKQEKLFWPKPGVTKGDYLIYLRQIAPYMLPFLKDKALTVIRCPDGVEGESFYQKHMPDYAPDYVAGAPSGNETLLHCRSIDGLVWFGNHGTMEYHVPFQYMGKNTPNEIVFDLDPPGIEAFDLAIFAATLLKQLLDQLQLIAFVKTSGNKGLQVYIPIHENSLTYEETAQFTQAIALLLEKKHNDLFTTERLKKNRHNRLYIDYVQHGKDKTLIAPYSPRKTEGATVSTPLFWNEVKEGLSPETFTFAHVLTRVKEFGCPFIGYQQARDEQDLTILKQFLQEK